jgi:hypothetical protein
MIEQAAELMANNREGLRAYEVQRAAEIEVMRTGPVSEPGPSISCMEDLTVRIAPTTRLRSSRSNHWSRAAGLARRA